MEYIKNRNFKIVASELVIAMPDDREIDGVRMKFDFYKLTYSIIFKKESFFLALNIFEIIKFDDCWVGNTLIFKFNDKIIHNKKLPEYQYIKKNNDSEIITHETILFDEVMNKIEGDIINNTNKIDSDEDINITVVFTNRQDLAYLNGIIIYKDFEDQKNNEYYLEKQLDAWRKDKLINW